MEEMVDELFRFNVPTIANGKGTVVVLANAEAIRKRQENNHEEGTLAVPNSDDEAENYIVEARAARRQLEPLVITRSAVSGMRSNHRSSRQCSECRRLIVPIGTATGRMWTSTWAPMAGSHGRLGDGRWRCDQRAQEFVSLRSCRKRRDTGYY